MAGVQQGGESRVLVALVNHRWSHPNLGVAALTEMSVELLRRAASEAGVRLEFVAVEPGAGALPSDVQRATESVRLKPWLAIQSWVRLVRLFRRASLVVDIGEGDGFAGIYGPRRLVWQLLPKLAGLVSGRPLILAPQTFGPFRGRAELAVFRLVCRHAALCAARDDVSAELARSAGPAARVELVADVAFGLPYESRPRELAVGRIDVGLNVSGLLWSATSADPFFVSSYRRVVSAVLDAFLEVPEIRVHMIPHVGGPDEGYSELPDRFAAREVLGDRAGVVLVEDFNSPVDAKSYIAEMDFFVGSRMHACIAAASSQVPLCALSYSRKFADTFRTVGLDVVVDPNSAEPAEIAGEVLRLVMDRGTQEAPLSQAMRRAATLADAYVDRLADRIGEVA